MKIVNMTPHAIHIVDGDGQVVKTYEKGDSQIRLAVKTVQLEPLEDGTPTSRTEFGEAEGLPEYEGYKSHFGPGEGGYDSDYDMDGSPLVYYIVSQLVKNAFPERTDLLVPAEVARDDKGVILGCRSLGR